MNNFFIFFSFLYLYFSNSLYLKLKNCLQVVFKAHFTWDWIGTQIILTFKIKEDSPNTFLLTEEETGTGVLACVAQGLYTYVLTGMVTWSIPTESIARGNKWFNFIDFIFYVINIWLNTCNIHKFYILLLKLQLKYSRAAQLSLCSLSRPAWQQRTDWKGNQI